MSGIATHDSPASEASVGELVSRASEQLTTLVRDEMRLAQTELAQRVGAAVSVWVCSAVLELWPGSVWEPLSPPQFLGCLWSSRHGSRP